MKKSFTAIPLVCLLFLTFGCQPVKEAFEEPVVDKEAAMQAASALYEKFNLASNSSDAVGLAACFTDDAIRIPANDSIVSGKAAILEGFQEFYAQSKEASKVEVHEAYMCGDMIYARGKWTSRTTPLEGGEALDIGGNWISILKKQTDESWKILWDIWTLEQLVAPWEENE